MAEFAEWDFFNRNVQSGLLEGRFLNAAFTLIAAGPPRLAALFDSTSQGLGGVAFPVGILQSIGIGQSSQLMRVWEIGSQRSYFIRGRTAGQISLGRIMYHGPSLLRVLYAYASGEDADGNELFKKLYANDAQSQLNLGASTLKGNKFEVAPGYDNLWLNLASDVFDQPVGLLVIMRDSNNHTVGAFYVEYCHVQNHNWQTDAGGTILAENVSLVYERIEPVKVDAVAIIADRTNIAAAVGGTVIGSAA
jgi:hypothetical protein